MTTLDVRIGQLRRRSRRIPVVKDLQVSTQFPHGMRIRVIEQMPVGAIVVGGRTDRRRRRRDAAARRRAAGVAADDPAAACCPGGTRVTEPDALQARRAAGGRARPAAGRISQVTDRRRPRPRRAAAHGPEHLLRRRRPTCARQVGRRRPRCWPTRARPARATSTSPIPAGPAAGVSAQAVADGRDWPAARRARTAGLAATHVHRRPRARTDPGERLDAPEAKPQVEVERRKSATLGPRSRVRAICNERCDEAQTVDFPHLQAITCETPATSD